jgi:hypothetical protein
MTAHQLKKLIEIQRDLWYTMNNNDLEDRGPSAGHIGEKLLEVLDVLVGGEYTPPWIGKEDDGPIDPEG